MVGEVFEGGEGDVEEGDVEEDDVQCLIVLQSLLRLDVIRSTDRNRILKWIY